ncbi:flagellar filament capping protein FliD [Pseudomonas sp. CDFA 602]|uniref:flagellar filament capping protein FliD n=1 Tax=Pseudomonas californiensis TaxID=2829823 RepID=UPI001E65676A|nr:flagellar filament capping protein FliD [Pseudomonas californiensis]MCD5992996.1 flagellar filament capping protein FliD [Pseudomonas californiensis]MCD5998373.1 flagellar filament capping protein FliD [Pseudomonas californiensis]
MASPITTSTGLGSGLKITDIVTVLVKSDKAAKQTQIDTQTKLTTTKLSGVSTLNSALDAFQTALTNLGKSDTPAFNGYSATSSAPNFLSVKSSNTAVAGNYGVEVKTLASSSTVASASFDATAASAIPSGTLTITQNTTDTSFDIPANSTLQSVRDLINTKTTQSGVSANIVTDSNGSRLIFTSNKTGAGSDIKTTSSISGLTIGTGTLDPTSPASAGRIGDAPVDGEITVSGLSIKSATNTYDTAVSGLSFTAVAKGSSTVSVASNSDGLKSSLQAFVDAYNTVVKTITSLSKATADSNGDLTVSAPMTGDSLPRDLLASMRSVLTTPGPGGKLSTLAQLGIQTAQTDGTLAFDQTKFTAAMQDKGLGGDIQQLFSGTDSNNGLLSRMSKSLDPYIKTGGLLDLRSTQLNKTKNELLDQQEALDIRIENLTASLSKKYNAMDLLVGKMKATQTSIVSFFDTLSAQQSKS